MFWCGVFSVCFYLFSSVVMLIVPTESGKRWAGPRAEGAEPQLIAPLGTRLLYLPPTCLHVSARPLSACTPLCTGRENLSWRAAVLSWRYL